MKYWNLEPEVAGEFSQQSVLDAKTHPPLVRAFTFKMTGWLGDDLLECFPCFIVTDKLSKSLILSDLSGFLIDSLELEISDKFFELTSSANIPNLKWLKITGNAGEHDFGLSNKHLLTVSEKTLSVLKRFSIKHCDISKY